MAKKKISNAIKRRLLLFGTLSIFIIVYTFFNIFIYVFNYVNLKKEEETLTYELLSLKEKEEDLTIELTKLKDPEYIARYARENYLYSRDGEYIIRIDKKDVEEKEEEKKNVFLPYIVFGSLGLFGILFIIKKK
jgi:cell division protein DivIC